MSSTNRLRNQLPKLRFGNSKRRKAPGAPPGTPNHTGNQHLEEVKIRVYRYSEDRLEEIAVDDIDHIGQYLQGPEKIWIQVLGLHDLSSLEAVWEYFDLHPLIREDIVNISQQPKSEEYDDCLFFVMRMLAVSDEQEKPLMHSEQVSLVLGPGYLLSFQETGRDYFAPVKERLSRSGTRIRTFKADYLMYALIDTAVDYYFHTLDHITDKIEATEDRLLEEYDQEILQQIHQLRRVLIFIRKSISPLRDALSSAVRDDTALIKDSTKLYLRDVTDHMVQVMALVDNYRDMILSLQDMYMSQVSNKMNEVMKVLTIIATIFIPLTFIAGIYGMNFNPEASPYNMPELNWYWGYPFSLGIMGLLALSMVFYFKKKDWL